MNIKLEDKIACFVGPPDSGKTSLARYLLTLPEYRSHLIYDPLGGFDPELFNVVRPPKETKYRRYQEGNPELNHAVDRFITGVEPKLRPRYFVVDEAGRLLPNGKPEGGAVGEINDFNAHLNLGLWIIGQRLQQLNSDLKNKATYYFITGYSGKNDKNYLDDIHEEASNYVNNQKSRYDFTLIGPNGQIDNYKSIDPMERDAKSYF